MENVVKKIFLTLLFLPVLSFADSIFFNKCNDSKTSQIIITLPGGCGEICEMTSVCESDKGEVRVTHLCKAKDGKCPDMISCIDDQSVIVKEEQEKDVQNNKPDYNSNGAVTK